MTSEPACPCPVCEGPLRRAHATHGVFACAGCGGLWTDHAATQALRSAHGDSIEKVAREAAAVASTTARATRPSRACPVCRAHLARTTLAGVELDYCPTHGTWYDRGEASAVCAATKKDGTTAWDIAEICIGVLSLFG